MSVEALPEASSQAPPGGPPTRPPLGERRWRVGGGVVAGVLLLASLALPVWQTTLHAPQYPRGLHMVAYGGRVTGDVREINELNHYVGMRAFRGEDIPELSLWLPTVLAALALVVVSVLAGRRWLGRLARLGVWVIPVGVLADIQFRLHQYGHDLDPTAPLRIKKFTPWAVGRTRVWNFNASSRPGLGLFAVLLAAAVLSFGPGLVVRARRARARRLRAATSPASGRIATGVAGAIALTILALAALPALAAASASASASSVPMAELRERLAAAPPGSTVTVGPGTYRGNLVIDRPVVLEGRGWPLLLGDGSGTVVTITAPATVVRGFRVRGSGPGPVGSPAGVQVAADGVSVEGMRIEDAYTGIAVVGAARARVVGNAIVGRRGTTIDGARHVLGGDMADMANMAGAADTGHDAGSLARGDGVSLWNARDALVRDNRIVRVRDGIYLSYANTALVDRNEVLDSRFAVHDMFARDLTLSENVARGNHAGAILMYGADVLLLRNTVRDSRTPSTGFGILAKDVARIRLVQNVVTGNRVGLQLEGTTADPADTEVRLNTVALDAVGVSLYPTAHATFSGNSFVENTVTVLANGPGVRGANRWTDRGAGNYWTGYRGYDRDGDGIGDVAHTEGGAVESLVARAPVLGALASGPALRLLAAVEDRWSSRQPVVTDGLPLMRPHSPPLVTAGHGAAGSAWPALAGPGAAASLFALVVGRRLRAAPRVAVVAPGRMAGVAA